MNRFKAGLKALTVAPVDTLAQFGGTAVPFIAASVLTGGAAAPALALGAVTGTGLVKGTIFDAVEQEYINQGVDPEQAREIAEQAQAYTGENLDQIALGGVLGAAAGRLGIERGITNLITQKVGQQAALPVGIKTIVGGAVAESIPEAVQAGQEKFAANISRQREGFDVDLMEGVVGQSVFEGGAGLILGGGVGTYTSRRNRLSNERQAELLEKKENEELAIQESIENEELAIQDSVGDLLAPEYDTTDLPDDFSVANLSPDPSPVETEIKLPARDLNIRDMQTEANRIVRQTNPDQEMTFVSEPTADGRGFQIIGSDQKAYGAPITGAETARQLSYRLNQTKRDQRSVRDANNSVNESGLSRENPSTLRNYLAIGSRVLNPRFNEVTAAEINYAADANTDESVLTDRRRRAIEKLPLDQAEYYLTQGAPANRAKSNAEKMRLLTPTQKENIKRRDKGQSEKSTFTMAEARRILGKNFGNLANPQPEITPEIEYLASISGNSVPISQREKGSPKKAKTLLKQGVYRFAEGAPKEVSLEKLNELFEQKNIISSVRSKEMQPLIKSFTGAGSYRTMTAGDRRVLYQKVNQLSDFAEPTKLPLYTSAGSSQVAQEVSQDAENNLALPAPEVSVDESAITDQPGEQAAQPEKRPVNAIAADKSKIKAEPEITQSQAAQDVADAQRAALDFLTANGMSQATAEVVASQAGGVAGSNAVNEVTQPPTQAGGWSKAKGKFDTLVFNVQDKFLDLKRVEQGIAKKAGIDSLPTLESAYDGIESITGKVGNEFRKLQEKVIKPLLVKLNDKGITRQELNDFLILRHAMERNEFVRTRNQANEGTNSYNPDLTDGGTGTLNGVRLTDAYVKDVMAKEFGLRWDDTAKDWVGGNSLAADMLNVAADFDAINQASLDDELKYGLISQKEFDSLSDKFKYYVPMRGKAENPEAPLSLKEEVDQNVGRRTSVNNLSTKGKEGQKITGRTGSQAFDPLANAYAARQGAIVRGIKNKEFGERLFNLIENNPNPEYWEVLGIGEAIPKGKTAIGFKQDGVQRNMVLYDRRLSEALLGMDAQSSSAILQVFRGLNRFLSAVNTSYNPEFVISNFTRDIQTALANIVGEESMAGGKAVDIKGLKKAILKDTLPSVRQVFKGLRNKNLDAETQKIWDTYLESGAKTDFFYARSPAETAKDIAALDEMATGTFKGSAKKRMDAFTGFVGDVNGAVENGVRFAVFKQARKSLIDAKISPAEANARAATLAKNLTVNFNRKGNQGELLNAAYLFFNASVQGTANFARGMSSKKKLGMMTAMTGFGALITYLNESFSDEEDDGGRSYYDNIPDYEKERNIIIMKDVFEPAAKILGLPFEESAEKYYKIPLPYGYNIFHLLGVNLAEMELGQKSPLQATGDLTSAAIGSFSPLGFASSDDPLVAIFKGATPQAFKPVIDLVSNENYFGSPIYREDFPGSAPTPDSSKGMLSTPQFMKDAAIFLNEFTGGNEQQSGGIDISPDVANHLLNSFTGGAGVFATRSAEYARKLRSGEKIELREIPFVRKIQGEADLRESQSNYYDRRDDIRQIVNRVDNLKGRERVNFRTDNIESIRMNSALRATDRRIKSLNQRLTDVREKILESTDIGIRLRLQDNEEKLQDQKDQAIARFNRKYDETVGRTK